MGEGHTSDSTQVRVAALDVMLRTSREEETGNLSSLTNGFFHGLSQCDHEVLHADP